MGNQVLPQRHFRRNMLDISRFFFLGGLVEVDLPKISQDVMGCRRNMEGNDFARHPSGSTWSFPCPTSTPVAASTRWGYGWLSWMSRVSMTEIDDFSQRANGLHWFWGFSSRLCMWNNQMVEVMLKVSNPSVFQPGQALKYVSFAVQMLGKSFKMPPARVAESWRNQPPNDDNFNGKSWEIIGNHNMMINHDKIVGDGTWVRYSEIPRFLLWSFDSKILGRSCGNKISMHISNAFRSDGFHISVPSLLGMMIPIYLYPLSKWRW